VRDERERKKRGRREEEEERREKREERRENRRVFVWFADPALFCGRALIPTRLFSLLLGEY
jgi:hypothetical protein